MLNITNKTVELNFEDVTEYAEFSAGIKSTNSTAKTDLNKYRETSKWNGCSYEEAQRRIKQGNAELVSELHGKIHVMQAMIEQEQRGVVRDVEGDYFDVGDVLQGEPECWRREEMGEVKPVVPVWVNFGMHCGITKEVICNRGAAVVALVDELQNQGYIVDLHIVHSTDFGNGIKFHMNIKVGTNPVDIDEIAYLLVDVSNLRRIAFTVLERLIYDDEYKAVLTKNKAMPSDWAKSVLGRPCEYILDDLFASGLSGFYFCSSNHDDFDSRYYGTLEKAKDHVLDMVKDFEDNAEQVIVG